MTISALPTNHLFSLSGLNCIGILLTLVLSGCSEEDFIPVPSEPIAESYPSEVISSWFDLVSTLTQETPGYTPPVAARAFGYTGIAVYESVAPGLASYQSLAGQLNEFELAVRPQAGASYHWPSSANAALATAIRTFYATTSPERLRAIDTLEARFRERFVQEVGSLIAVRSATFGTQVAKEVLAWAAEDGGDNGASSNFPEYLPPRGEGNWVPTPPNYSAALQPYWGSNRPFITANVTETQPVAPLDFSRDTTSEFYQSAWEVYQTVNNVTPEQVVIAEFWSDDPVTSATPPGHSIAILNQVLRQENARLGVAAEAYAKLGIAISDAFISCWQTKYQYNVLRPVTYINRYIDSTWQPILNTPPFPEYTSGHSVQSGAMAAVLTDLFGDNYDFIDSTHVNRNDIDGTPRRFGSFVEMAEEADVSRLYGGIHYREAIERGLTQGYAIGERVNRIATTNALAQTEYE